MIVAPGWSGVDAGTVAQVGCQHRRPGGGRRGLGGADRRGEQAEERYEQRRRTSSLHGGDAITGRASQRYRPDATPGQISAAAASVAGDAGSAAHCENPDHTHDSPPELVLSQSFILAPVPASQEA